MYKNWSSDMNSLLSIDKLIVFETLALDKNDERDLLTQKINDKWKN